MHDMHPTSLTRILLVSPKSSWISMLARHTLPGSLKVTQSTSSSFLYPRSGTRPTMLRYQTVTPQSSTLGSRGMTPHTTPLGTMWRDKEYDEKKYYIIKLNVQQPTTKFKPHAQQANLKLSSVYSTWSHRRDIGPQPIRSRRSDKLKENRTSR